jgi:hypothetical protein
MQEWPYEQDMQQPVGNNTNDSVLISSERILTRLLNQIWIVLLFVLILGGTASLLRSQVTGWQPIYNLQIVLIIFFICCHLLRKRLPLNIRVGIVMTVFYIAGIGALYSIGMVGAGAWWLILCALIAKVFYPVKVGIAHAGVCLVLIMGAAYSYITGMRTLPFDIDEYLSSPATWASLIIGCVLLSFFIFAALAAYQRATLALLKQVTENTRQLEQNMEEFGGVLVSREGDSSTTPEAAGGRG